MLASFSATNQSIDYYQMTSMIWEPFSCFIVIHGGMNDDIITLVPINRCGNRLFVAKLQS